MTPSEAWYRQSKLLAPAVGHDCALSTVGVNEAASSTHTNADLEHGLSLSFSTFLSALCPFLLVGVDLE